ncbi:MAG TPA: hypothetical protein VF941_20805 [Clostridia bacterium]
MEVSKFFRTGIAISTLASGLSKLFFQEVTFLVLIICVFSGVLFLYKKIIDHEPISMADFVYGIENNWKKVLVTGLCFIFTIGILKEIAVWLVLRLGSIDDVKIIYVTTSITSAIGFFYIALTIYGSLILVENGIRIRKLFSGIFRFIFSKEALKLFIILLLFGFLYQPINILKSNCLSISSLLNGGSLFSFMDIISAQRIPLWLRCMEWFANTIVTSFILLYTSLIFYWSKRKNE